MTIDFHCDNDELKFAIKQIQSIIDENDRIQKQNDDDRKARKKKKTIEELRQEIEDDIDYYKQEIVDNHIEIENLEAKRLELENYDENKPEVKPKKKGKKVTECAI